jgi:hypothetical protein
MHILGCGLGWQVQGTKARRGEFEEWTLTLGQDTALGREAPERHKIPPGLAKVVFIGYRVLQGLADVPFSDEDKNRILDAWGLPREKDFRGVEVHRL